ncbi:MAG TPA: methyltransferase domain-containing protein [Candidatus Limnocylindrales bacterium]|nr:methyltransferase domain-containing protein [Candidatus Limnocylindrales bacterium]
MTSFDERARDWDSDEHIATATAVANAIRSAVPLAPTTKALEIGAGTGLLGLALLDDLGELVLSDPSAGMRDVALEKVRQGGLANVRVEDLDLLGERAPSPRRFDLVISQLMLHHVKDTAGLLRATNQMLVPGGRIAMADLDSEDGTFHDPAAEGIHHHGFPREALRDLAADAGFEDIEFGDATAIPRNGRTYPLFLLIARKPAAEPRANEAAQPGL